MVTHINTKPLVLSNNKRKINRKVQSSPNAVVQAEKNRFLFTLTVLTWIVAAFVAIAFYYAVRNAMVEADWLACLLLGTLFIGWIMVARLVGAPPVGQGDRHETYKG